LSAQHAATPRASHDTNQTFAFNRPNSGAADLLDKLPKVSFCLSNHPQVADGFLFVWNLFSIKGKQPLRFHANKNEAEIEGWRVKQTIRENTDRHKDGQMDERTNRT